MYSRGYEVHGEVLEDAEHSDAKVCHGQIRQEEVRDGAQSSAQCHHQNHQ